MINLDSHVYGNMDLSREYVVRPLFLDFDGGGARNDHLKNERVIRVPEGEGYSLHLSLQ
jgi:hypothetical protein